MTTGTNNWNNVFLQLFLVHQLAVSHPRVM